MLSNKKTKTKLITFLPALLPLILLSQNETTKAVYAVQGNSEMIWYMLYCIMGVLLLVIMVLGNVLLSLVKVTIENGKVKSAAALLLLLLSGSLFSQDVQATGNATASSAFGTGWNMVMALTVLGTEIFVVLVLILRIYSLVNELAPNKATKPLPYSFTRIPELLNSLPAWWKYSFIISVFCIMGYLTYHLSSRHSGQSEYEATMAVAKTQQAEYARLNARKVDENTVMLADAAGIEDGKIIFATNCAPCHGQKGEGVVGPNLTDDYWLHGGSISDVFKSVKYGWPDKAMKSWQADLSPVQIKNVVSYIKSLHGTNPPNAKAPQGDLYNESGAAKTANVSQVASDSSKAKNI